MIRECIVLLSSLIFDQVMLQSLIKKIKSQKSQTQSSKQPSKSKEEQIQLIATLQSFNNSQMSYPQSCAFHEIESQVKRIRYCAFQQGPSLYTSILACPISSFNLLPYAKRKVKQIDLSKDPLPSYIEPLKPILNKQLPTFNHLLINVYPPGVGIMPHFDGPLYKSKVVVLSLGGPVVIHFSDSYKNTNKVAQILLEDQSIHIFEEEAYRKYLHGIQDFIVDCIFIKVDFLEGERPKISRSSVANFHLTRFYSIIIQKLSQIATLDSFQELDLGKETNTLSCLISIKQNEQYNFKIQIMRQERISITIRERINEVSQYI